MNVQQLKKLMTDDDAISPVIGVVLMLAVVLILAASVAAFVFGLGNGLQGSDAPQAQFDYNPANVDVDGDGPVQDDSYRIVMTGGDNINSDRLSVKGPMNDDQVSYNPDGVSQVSSGDTVAEVEGATDGEIRIVWTNPEDTDSSVIGTHEV